MMVQKTPAMSALADTALWTQWLNNIEIWFNTTLASVDTLIELAVIIAAAAIAWPFSRVIRRKIIAIGEQHNRIALLRRSWVMLAQIAFPVIWLFVQWSASAIMQELGFRDGIIVITSSLLSAWIVISIVTVFVANPIGSRIIAVLAWLLAALNIIGRLDDTISLLEQASFSLGKIEVSALTMLQGLIALTVLLWLTALLAQLLESRIKSSINLTPSIKVLSTKLVRIGLAIAACIFALSIVGIDLTAFAVFGGAIGVGLGFGLQKIFANLISGFILLVDKSIKPGDVIAVANDYGRVDALGARYVSVLTRDGIEHLIPNEELIITRVENWSHTHNLIRLRKTVGIHYKADVRLAIELCKAAMSETARILQDPPPVVLLRDFGESSVDLELRFWINDPMNGRANVVSAVLLSIWDKFAANDIEIPYPQRDLHLRSSIDLNARSNE